MKSKKSKITIRQPKVNTVTAKAALVEFFKLNVVCSKCGGLGFTDKHKIIEGLPEYTTIYVGDLEEVEKIVENAENLASELRDIIYRQSGIRKDCKACNGKKYVARSCPIK